MKVPKLPVCSVLLILVLFSQAVFAVPVFQVYIEDAVAGTVGKDKDSWITTSSSFDLIVAGAYGNNTKALTNVTLLISVPKNETGTISITGGEVAALLAEKKAISEGYNPNSDADLDVLANEAGNINGFDGYEDKSFVPQPLHSTNHYPFQEKVSNFVLYSLGDFDRITNAVSYYNSKKSIEYNVADGQEKEYSVSLSGFSFVHFDAYGCELTENGKNVGTSWHMSTIDASAYPTPEPATLLLLGLGGLAVRRRGRNRPKSISVR